MRRELGFFEREIDLSYIVSGDSVDFMYNKD